MPRASGPPEATPQFIGAITQLKRLARGSDFLARQAKAVLERVDKAIVKLDKDYCAGSRLRGPGLTEICEVRLAGGWRVLYKVNPQKKVPVLLMVGQHYRDISVAQGRRQDRAAARRPLVQALSFNHTDGRWRTPGSWLDRTYPDPTMYEDLARIAERGCIDMLFCGDGTGIPSTWQGSEEVAARWGIQWPRQDMSPYISVMSRVTEHIGFALTYSSTFMPPFYVARLLNSLDHLTNGRMAFNVITSTRRADAANYGFDELMDHDLRYDRMEEFIDVCKALWASVEPDAFIWDRETGVVADPAKIQPINHAGRFFKVRGPLSTVPSPQVCPVLIQAGGSPRGIRASAHFAEVIFAIGPRAAKIKHRQALDEALQVEGRNPAKVGILFSTTMIVRETREEAQAQREQLLTLIPPEAVGAYLSHNAGYDFSRLPDRFRPADLNREIIASQASPVGFVAMLANQLGEGAEISREEFFHHGLRFATGYDRVVAGTASDVADFLEEEFEATGCRGGFMITYPYSTPGDALNIVDFLVPERQRRGRFRTKYEGRTLRENLCG